MVWMRCHSGWSSRLAAWESATVVALATAAAASATLGGAGAVAGSTGAQAPGGGRPPALWCSDFCFTAATSAATDIWTSAAGAPLQISSHAAQTSSSSGCPVSFAGSVESCHRGIESMGR